MQTEHRIRLADERTLAWTPAPLAVHRATDARNGRYRAAVAASPRRREPAR